MFNLFNFNEVELRKNPFFLYTVANFAKEHFKNKIVELDKGHIYNKKREDIIINPDYYKTKEFQEKNYLLEEAKEKWKKEHIHYYRQQPCLPSTKICNIFCYIPSSTTLEEAIQGYKAANELLNSIPNSDLDPYCVETRLMLNYEHKEEYDTFIKETKKKLGFIDEEELIKYYPLTTIKYRLSLDRSKCANIEPLNKFINNFIKNAQKELNTLDMLFKK